MKNGNILVIEPNNGLLTSLVILLRKHFDTVSATDTLQEAEGLLAINLFDVILLDLDLFRNRSEAAGKVAEFIDSGRGAEMVLLSTFAQVPTASECMEKGAFDFVHKPWNVTEIVTSLNNAIAKKRLLGRIKELENALEKAQSETKIEQVGTEKARPLESRPSIAGGNAPDNSIGTERRYDSIGSDSRYDNICTESRYSSIGADSRYDNIGTESRYSSIGAERIYSVTEDDTLEQIERKIISRVLTRNRGNMSLTALQLGITRQTLYNKMKKQ